MSISYHTIPFIEEFAAAPKTRKLFERFGEQGRNQMLFDLGLEAQDMEKDELVRKKIEEIDEVFDLVMIVEKFNESLVLLKEELCWEVDDLTSFKLNGRQDKVKENLNKETRRQLKEFLKADYQLYNHFHKKLVEKLKAFGVEKITEEIQQLEKRKAKISAECSVESVNNEKLHGDNGGEIIW